ncbi:MAG TPA: PA14 domain-containing protein, partial [Chitinophagaceae bacterium]|nr:PA14 domain-containing protein [Chitinophagaceae bacterium]
MKKFLFCLSLLTTVTFESVLAQANIFNPNDPMVEYSEANPPATPAPNTLTKWVRRKLMTWNTDKFKSYSYDGMAFRLRFPNNYDPAKKYPVILFFHGGGETDAAVSNEYHLIHGAQQFEQMIDAGQFNAFMLFPQVSPPSSGWDNVYFERINHVLDSMQKYCNSDPDRVISVGLSMGGLAAIRYGAIHPQRAAVGIGASPALIQNMSAENRTNLLQIPMWIANGGVDVNPDTPTVNNFINEMRSKGADVRQNLYPDWGHNVWYNQWAEPHLLPYWKAAHKSNPILYFQKSTFTTEAGLNAKMGITAGFAQYQWQKNNVDVPGATSNEYTATTFGTYRVTFKRTASSNWAEWSPNPIVLSLDNSGPTAPNGLVSAFTGSNFANLAWNPSTDDSKVTGYDVYFNGVKKYTTVNNYITVENLAPNTLYKITVKALDESGNNSPSSNELPITTLDSQNGLKYRYYEGTYTSLPDFSTLAPVVRSGLTPNVIISNSRPDNYAYIWEGYINITNPGQYTFETISDDGSKLYFNTFYAPGATALVNNDGLHASVSATGNINIPAVGLYPIAITFFESTGGETMQIFWSG